MNNISPEGRKYDLKDLEESVRILSPKERSILISLMVNPVHGVTKLYYERFRERDLQVKKEEAQKLLQGLKDKGFVEQGTEESSEEGVEFIRTENGDCYRLTEPYRVTYGYSVLKQILNPTED